MSDLTGAADSTGGTVALLTGAAGGIGQAIATRLAAAGVRVMLHVHRGREAGEALLRALPGCGHGLFTADLTDSTARDGLIDQVLAEAGRIDVLINNAGIAVLHPPLAVDAATWAAAWDQTLALNLTAPAHLCHRVAGQMAGQGGGRIINISSRGAFRGEPMMPAYGASKAGLNALTQSLARALAPLGIACFAVAPGWVATPMSAERREAEAETIAREHPLGRVATPEEVAETVTFLATAPVEAMTGAILDINGASYLRS